MKKKFLIISIIILITLFSFTTYQLIKFFDYKSSLSNLEKYVFVNNETTIKKLEYNNKNYMISRYYYNSSSWSHLNLFIFSI